MARHARSELLTPLLAIALAQDLPRDRPGEVMPKRRWDIEHLDLRVEINPKTRSLRGKTTHHIQPLLPHSTFRLHQRSLEIESVEVDGVQVEPRIGLGSIDIPVEPGRSHEVVVHYAATPEMGMFFRDKKSGYGFTEVWTQGEGEDNRYWFPSWDYPNDLFTVNTTVVAPEKLVVRANGVLVGVTAEDGKKSWSFELEQPIVNYLVALTAGEYQVIEDRSEGVPLEILGGAKEDPEVLKNGAGQVDRMLAYYNDLLGVPYPYPIYRQIFVQGFLYGGMENATVTTLTDERLVEPGGEARVARLETVVAHELVHHWFGDLLTCYGWRELWLNEGFATFYEQRWKEHTYGPEHAAASRQRTRRRAIEVTGPMSARAHSFEGKQNQGVYVRGSSVLHALRVHFGDELFDRTIRRWVSENRHQLVEGESLRRLFEDSTGEHLGWFWDQWVTNGGNPTWNTSWKHEDGQLTISIEQEEGPVFHTPVEIQIGTDPVQTHKIWVDDRSELVFAVEQPPDWVSIDPRGGVLGTFNMTQPEAAWIAQLEGSPTPLARLDALEGLSDRSTPAAAQATAAHAEGNTDPAFRRPAVKALATQDHALARQALIRLLKADDSYLREAAVEALESQEATQPVLAALRRTYEVDRDPRVRARALTVLAAHLGPKALKISRTRLERADRSRTHPEHIAALEILETRGTLEDARAALRFLDADHPRWVRITSLITIREILLRSDEKSQEPVQRAFAKRLATLLHHPDYRMRQKVVQAYKAVHTDDLDELERFMSRTEVNKEKEAAAAVLAWRHTPPGEEPDEQLERRLDELETGASKTQERLDALEQWRP